MGLVYGFRIQRQSFYSVACLEDKVCTTSHKALNQMVMNNHFTTNLNATSAQDLVDEKGNTILADWSYEVASGEVGKDWKYKIKEE